VLAVSATYLYSIAQLAGWVWHDMHLLWFTALLAASPSADVLAFDAARPLETEGKAYAPAIWAARLLLAAIYFFPGFHKLATSGLSWALSDNLRNQLWWKWAQHGVVPSFRVDQSSWLLQAGGLFVLAFELGFPLFVLFKRTRALAALLGVAFHLMSRFLFRIPFESLWLCYVVLFDPRPLLRRLPLPASIRAPELELPARSPGFGGGVVGALLLAGALVQGARGQMQSYPFACYPTFQWRAGTSMPDLMIARVDANGNELELEHARSAHGYRTQRQWAELWSLAGVTAAVDPARLVAYYRSATQGPAGRVRFYRAERSIAPEDRKRPPLAKKLLYETSITR
jgi:uncharacterized membrane protein YphA (DoxX/SURF4 family)